MANGATCLGNTSYVQGTVATTPTYYTFEVTGAGTYTLPPGSFCTPAQNQTATTGANGLDASTGAPAPAGPVDGDQTSIQVIGFDYPAYEASYPNSLGVPAPNISGAAGASVNSINGAAGHQADITISPKTIYAMPAAGTLVQTQSLHRVPGR